MRLGCERLFDPDISGLWKGRSIGLVTNYTGVDSRFRRTVDMLKEQGANVVRLFTAEHGFYGAAQAGEHVYSETDRKTGVEIVSLYNENKKMTPAMLEGIDLLMLEFQDVGVRFYTYLSTMFRVMMAASEDGVSFVLLDRPNPVGGWMVEGPGVAEDCLSFVGDYDLPIRHGMTLGELALLYRDETALNLDLHVIPMEGWSRDQLFTDTGLQWIPPSPNMPTFVTAQLYPGTCFFEGTNLSEGRGTAMPFQWIGAPWIDGERLADALNDLNLPGVHFRPFVFVPSFSKHEGKRVEGVHVHLLNEKKVQPVSLGLFMIDAIKRLYPDDFAWLPPFKGRYFIDLLWGSRRYREDLDRGRQVEEILHEWREKAESFRERRTRYLLYS